MNAPSFVEARKTVAKWLNSDLDRFKNNNISVEILKDNKHCLRVELNFGEVLAEIIVEEPGFAPYRFVSFQAGDIINGVPEMVHFWYDEENTTNEEIIENLNKAVDIVLAYNKSLIENDII